MALPILVLRETPNQSSVPQDDTPRRRTDQRRQAAPKRNLAAGQALSVYVLHGEVRDAMFRYWRQALRLQNKRREVSPITRAKPDRRKMLCAGWHRADLLRDAESLLRILLRRSRPQMLRNERLAWLAALRRFDPCAPTLALPLERAPYAAWLLAAMHWRGCRHPSAVHSKPLHPPTGLHRWLNTVELNRQVERPTDVLRSLVVEIKRVERESYRIITAMLKRGSEIALLPELLR